MITITTMTDSSSSTAVTVLVRNSMFTHHLYC